MKNKLIHLPPLNHRCTPMQRKNITPSGVTPDALLSQELALVSSQPSCSSELHDRAFQIRGEITSISGLTEHALKRLAHDVQDAYNEWVTGRQKGTTAVLSPFDWFCLMLIERPSPWLQISGGTFNRFSYPQLLLAWAYGDAHFAVEVLSAYPSPHHLYVDCSDVHASSAIDDAAEVLTHAKRVIELERIEKIDGPKPAVEWRLPSCLRAVS